MRRIVALVVAALALLGAGTVSRPDASSARIRLDAASPRGPLLGIVQDNRAAKLVRVDRRSLRPLRGRGITVPNTWSWAFSHDRSRLVLPGHRVVRKLPRASLRFVDVLRLRAAGRVSLGLGTVNHMSWLTRDRVLVVQQLCCTGRFDLVVVDPRARRILERTTLEGDLVQVAGTPDELVLLVAPPEKIGPSRLLVVDSRARIRSAALDGIWAGRDVAEVESAPFVSRHRNPGLAVDYEGRRVLVVPADGPVTSIDLSSLAVTYHTLTEPRSLLGRLRNWLEPAAQAKASDGTSRQALWVGAGLLAVTGSDDHTFLGAENALSMRTDPAGLSLIDTNTWTVRRIDDSVSHVSRTGTLLLATGYSWDSSAQREGGNGLAGYALDGTKRFHLFQGRNLTRLAVYGARAYVGHQGTARVGATYMRLDDGSAFKTVDLKTGRIIGTRTAPLPMLLVEQSG